MMKPCLELTILTTKWNETQFRIAWKALNEKMSSHTEKTLKIGIESWNGPEQKSFPKQNSKQKSKEIGPMHPDHSTALYLPGVPENLQELDWRAGEKLKTIANEKLQKVLNVKDSKKLQKIELQMRNCKKVLKTPNQHKTYFPKVEMAFSKFDSSGDDKLDYRSQTYWNI